jgi:hypothetical protein
MCYFRLYLYNCNCFFFWGKRARSCPLEESFQAGKYPVACGEKWRTPIQTVRVAVACPKCHDARKAEEEALVMQRQYWQRKDDETRRVQALQKKKQDDVLARVREGVEGAKEKLEKLRHVDEDGGFDKGNDEHARAWISERFEKVDPNDLLGETY